MSHAYVANQWWPGGGWRENCARNLKSHQGLVWFFYLLNFSAGPAGFFTRATGVRISLNEYCRKRKSFCRAVYWCDNVRDFFTSFIFFSSSHTTQRATRWNLIILILCQKLERNLAAVGAHAVYINIHYFACRTPPAAAEVNSSLSRAAVVLSSVHNNILRVCTSRRASFFTDRRCTHTNLTQFLWAPI